MALKIAAASAEEYVFAQEVNKRLNGTGASVHAFTRVDTETDAKTYGLVFQAGGKRETITADGPFHYDAPEDVVRQVHQWLAGAGQADRWTTDLEAADRSM